MATFYKDANGRLLVALQVETPVPEGYAALEANTTDAAAEKHVPVIDVQHDGRVIQVTVGSAQHPMEREHHIEWIALEADDRLELHRLEPGQSPVAFFPGGVKSGTVYAYCNLHGLWKAQF